MHLRAPPTWNLYLSGAKGTVASNLCYSLHRELASYIYRIIFFCFFWRSPPPYYCDKKYQKKPIDCIGDHQQIIITKKFNSFSFLGNKNNFLLLDVCVCDVRLLDLNGENNFYLIKEKPLSPECRQSRVTSRSGRLFKKNKIIFFDFMYSPSIAYYISEKCCFRLNKIVLDCVQDLLPVCERNGQQTKKSLANCHLCLKQKR